MFAYPYGATYSVTFVTAHALCILVNHEVKGCLYISREMSSDVCGPITLCPPECACVVTQTLQI